MIKIYNMSFFHCKDIGSDDRCSLHELVETWLCRVFFPVDWFQTSIHSFHDYTKIVAPTITFWEDKSRAIGESISRRSQWEIIGVRISKYFHDYWQLRVRIANLYFPLSMNLPCVPLSPLSPLAAAWIVAFGGQRSSSHSSDWVGPEKPKNDICFHGTPKKQVSTTVQKGGTLPVINGVPIGSMYGVFTYMYHKNQPNVGKYSIHGSDPMGL